MKGITTCASCADGTNQPQVHFFCQRDGLLHQEMVSLICNKCQKSELVYRDGMYLCPKCLTNQESFQCRRCDSKEVTLLGKDEKND